MKLFRLFRLFVAILVLNSTLNLGFILKTLQNNKILSNYVCKITKDIIKSKYDTQDVLIGNLGGKVWSSTVNEIAGCVKDSVVVVSDFSKKMTEKSLRKAAIVIVLINEVDMV